MTKKSPTHHSSFYLRRIALLLMFVEQNGFEVHVGPGVPSFVPLGVMICGRCIAHEHRSDALFVQSLQRFLPFAQF